MQQEQVDVSVETDYGDENCSWIEEPIYWISLVNHAIKSTDSTELHEQHPTQYTVLKEQHPTQYPVS